MIIRSMNDYIPHVTYLYNFDNMRTSVTEPGIYGIKVECTWQVFILPGGNLLRHKLVIHREVTDLKAVHIPWEI